MSEEATQEVRTRAPVRGGRRYDVSVTAGFFAATEPRIQLAAAKPAPAPSDAEIYTGSILFVPDDGRVCRRFLFDNRTGRFSIVVSSIVRAPIIEPRGRRPRPLPER